MTRFPRNKGRFLLGKKKNSFVQHQLAEFSHALATITIGNVGYPVRHNDDKLGRICVVRHRIEPNEACQEGPLTMPAAVLAEVLLVVWVNVLALGKRERRLEGTLQIPTVTSSRR